MPKNKSNRILGGKSKQIVPELIRMKKLVSVILPTRNEGKFIVSTLASILSQDYPQEFLEIIVADGRSDDNTREEINSFSKLHSNIRLIDNPERVVPFALNYAIEQSSGEIIVRMDSHSVYPPNYISRLVEELLKSNADNVGGVVITSSANSSLIATSIALATSHKLGIGDSSFRLDTKEVKQVDTVPFGCFRREVFDKVGKFDTDLVRNQDDEFNGRIIKNGGQILLIPDVKITYYARPNWSTMRKMFYHYGLFKPLVNKKLGAPATIRQFIPPLFVLGVVSAVLIPFLPYFEILWSVGMLFYLGITLLVSLSIAVRNNRILLFFTLPITFWSVHISYGMGYIIGFIRTFILKQNIGKANFSTSR